MLLPHAAGVHRYWHDLPQAERDAHLENPGATAEDVAEDVAQDPNANVEGADYHASTLFRYAHARCLLSLRCCFYVVRYCLHLFIY